MRIGIDLLWVRPGIVGGTESVIRNLIQGFGTYDSKNEYILFTAKDNEESFHCYLQYPNVSIVICNVNCRKQAIRIAWENCFLDNKATKENIEIMFIPVYSKPRTYGSNIPYVSVIHDLQALHYPEYFSWLKRTFLKKAWKHTCQTSQWIVTISNYCKIDLIENYPFVTNKVTTIYNPIISQKSNYDFSDLSKRYKIEKEQYYYCVSSMLPHKNLETILRVMSKLKKNNFSNIKLPKLVISGVGGKGELICSAMSKYDIEELVVLTGYISNDERDCLYENCQLFLFPSVFEGFGMPPIEAMRKGKTVVMTEKSCLKEVTEGKAIYVEKPMDDDEWIEKIQYAQKIPAHTEKFEQYKLENIIKEYLNVFQHVYQSKNGNL